MMERRQNICIVEDNVTIGTLLSSYYFPDHNVEWFKDHFENLLDESVWQGTDAALIDYQLAPGMNGAEIIHMLNNKVPNVRVVLLTGSVDPLTIESEISTLSNTNILIKPESPERIRAALGLTPEIPRLKHAS